MKMIIICEEEERGVRRTPLSFHGIKGETAYGSLSLSRS